MMIRVVNLYSTFFFYRSQFTQSSQLFKISSYLTYNYFLYELLHLIIIISIETVKINMQVLLHSLIEYSDSNNLFMNLVKCIHRK